MDDDDKPMPWLSPAAYIQLAEDAHDRRFFDLERMWRKRAQDACVKRFEETCARSPRSVVGGPLVIAMELL